MIHSTLKYSERIEPLHPLYKTLFDYVKTHDLRQMECGRIEIDGDNLYINLCTPESKKATEQVHEVHREYIDVHFLIEGEETIGCSIIDDMKELVHDYDPKGDAYLYADMATNYIKMKPGDFLIVYPEDPHAPLIGEGRIKKAIAKVKINYLNTTDK